MINIHFTGAKTLNAQQPNPYLSLGGLLSSSKISDNINNLFPEYSLNEMNNELPTVRGIIIKNITNQALENVGVGILRAAGERSRIFIGVVELNNDAMEHIDDDRYDPSSAIFYEIYMTDATDVENLLYIGDMEINKKYGLWVKRVLYNEYKDTGDYCQLYEDPQKETGFQLIFKTDTEPPECDCDGNNDGSHGEIIVQFAVAQDSITSYQNEKLKGEIDIVVAKEGFTMYEGEGEGEYQRNATTGTIEFNSPVYNSERILIFKL